MVYFLVRMAVYIVAAVLVMNVVPGLRLAPYPFIGEPYTEIAAYVVIGVVFGILHNFVRPVILVLAGRFYIWSMGLLALVSDVLIFMLVTYIAPTDWYVSESRLLSSLLGAVLMGVVVISLEAAIGFDSPRIARQRRTPFYWRWLARWPGSGRNRLVESLRTRQMVAIIQSYGMDILVGLSPLRGFRRFMQRIIYRGRPRLTEDDPAVKVRLMVQELGPTFVKFAQLVASRVDVLPPAFQAELVKLEDDVPAFPYEEVRLVVQRALGGPPESVFASFDPKPLAAASMGQVHAATLPTGEKVVVKVRRPDVDVTIRGDLSVMRDVIDTTERRLQWFRKFGLGELFSEFAENVLTEIDYTDEAYHARLLRHNMQGFARVHVPKIYVDYCSDDVLTLERVRGVKITNTAAIDAAGIDRQRLALDFFRALLQQVLFDGFFHADLHPGNVWVELPSARVLFIDMGMMGYLSRRDRFLLAQVIWGLHDNDSHMVTRVLLRVCRPVADRDDRALGRDIARLMNRHLLFATAMPSVTVLIGELVGLLYRHGLQLRREFTLAFKTLGQAESIMRKLLGERSVSDILQITYVTMRGLLLAQLGPRKVTDDLAAPFIRDLVGRIPALLQAATKLSDEFEAGTSVFQLDVERFDHTFGKFESSLALGARQLVLSMSLVGLLLASAFVLSLPLENRVGQFEMLVIRRSATAGLVISAGLTVFMLLNTLWRMMREPRSRRR